MIGNIDSGERDRLHLNAEVELFYSDHPSGYRLPRFKLLQS